ncbi:MAG: TRAP transporter small permease subunit [Pseudomonadota bacterium]
MKIVIHFLDGIVDVIGRSVSWLSLCMILAMLLSIILSFFKVNVIALQESITWMNALLVLLGVAITLQHNEHVRVDIFYQNFSPAKKAWIDLLGHLIFLIPVCSFILWMSWQFIVNSWYGCEASSEAGGLPARYLIRGLFLLLPIFLLIQGISQVIKQFDFLMRQARNHPTHLLSPRTRFYCEIFSQITAIIFLLSVTIFSMHWMTGYCAQRNDDLVTSFAFILALTLLFGPVLFVSVRMIIQSKMTYLSYKNLEKN